MLLQVHDELVFDLYLPEKERVLAAVHDPHEERAALAQGPHRRRDRPRRELARSPLGMDWEHDPRLRKLKLWVAVAAYVWLLSVIGCYFGWNLWVNCWLEYHGVHAVGGITAVHPENHSTAEFKFDYLGTTYRGEEMRMGNLPVGAVVDVTFDSRNPKNAIISDPAANIRESAITLFLFAVLPPLAYLVLRRVQQINAAKTRVSA